MPQKIRNFCRLSYLFTLLLDRLGLHEIPRCGFTEHVVLIVVFLLESAALFRSGCQQRAQPGDASKSILIMNMHVRSCYLDR
jgi:hypothetical protein